MKTLKANTNFKLEINPNFQLYAASSSKPYKYPTKSRFEIHENKKRELYYWVLMATNGRIILRCLKGYATKNDCVASIKDVFTYGQDVYNFEMETENRQSGGMYYLLINPETGNNVAVSGNGKGYALKNKKESYNIALIQQVIYNGVQKGIKSTVKNIKSIQMKNKPILDFTS